jgi:hypothetical protein
MKHLLFQKISNERSLAELDENLKAQGLRSDLLVTTDDAGLAWAYIIAPH